MADDKTTKLHPNTKDISGKRFGRLTIVSISHSSPCSSGTKLYWHCLCDCGNKVVIPTGNIKNGHTKSCGCLDRDVLIARNTKHGLWKRPEFNVWLSAKGRCFTPTDEAFNNYGGRGITMCDQWKNSFEQFLQDMGPRPTGLTLERRDVNGHYEPSNCYWADWLSQGRNKRNTIRVTHEGLTLTLKEWAARTGIPYGVLLHRWHHPERVSMFAPIRKGNYRKGSRG